MSDTHERYMRLALEEAAKAKAAGNGAYGAVVVRDGQVIATGRNEATTTSDPTAHAETIAVRNAGMALGTLDLSGCTLYATFQPCPMCCGSILVSGIRTVVIGAVPDDPAQTRWPTYSVDRLVEWLGYQDRVTVITGVLADECRAILQP